MIKTVVVQAIDKSLADNGLTIWLKASVRFTIDDGSTSDVDLYYDQDLIDQINAGALSMADATTEACRRYYRANLSASPAPTPAPVVSVPKEDIPSVAVGDVVQ